MTITTDGGAVVIDGPWATTAAAVRQYRKAAAALRGFATRAEANISGNAATYQAIARHKNHQDFAVAWLLAHDGRTLVGLLAAEEQLADRVRRARRDGADRPELATRLALARRAVNTETKGRTP